MKLPSKEEMATLVLLGWRQTPYDKTLGKCNACLKSGYTLYKHPESEGQYCMKNWRNLEDFLKRTKTS